LLKKLEKSIVGIGSKRKFQIAVWPRQPKQVSEEQTIEVEYPEIQEGERIRRGIINKNAALIGAVPCGGGSTLKK
jgi:hypothetical protein